jgi:hypothetical protein
MAVRVSWQSLRIAATSAHDRARGAVIEAARLAEVGRHGGGVVDHVGVADDGAQVGEEAEHGH